MMDTLSLQKNNKQVATWLLIGVGMIVIQVLLGGITRLTESGLSITEWKPLTGALPPLNTAAWQLEFEKYRTTDQFKYVHQSFSLSDFKFIFFWEWFHRLWARTMGMVFLIGFIYFLLRKKFNKQMILPMVILFVLGAMQGAIGWLMVKSGLVPEKFYVGHVELTTHLIAALILLSYTLWFAMSLLPALQQKVQQKNLKNMLQFLTVLLFFQLIYGGFMAGLRAGSSAPTWPSINGQFLPAAATELSPWIQNLVNNKFMIHFIHRGLAYVLFFTVLLFYIRSRNITGNIYFAKFRQILMSIVSIQVLLGILTVVNSTNTKALVWLGVTHQFTAMLLVMCVVVLLFLFSKEKLKQVQA